MQRLVRKIESASLILLLRQHISQGKAEDTLLFSFPPVEDRKDSIEKDIGIADPGITLHDIYYVVLLLRKNPVCHLLFQSIYRYGKLPPYALSSSSAYKH